ncbi:MAG: tetratricopeptide repeat protein [Gemmataceae bacterium]
MATHATPTATANGGQVHPAMPQALWQAPVFVLGLAALVGVWFARPLWPDSPARALDRDLGTVRQLLARSDGDPEQAISIAHRALEACARFPERAGEAQLLLGTAHLRLAEKADALRAREEWLKARQYLEQADASEVPEEDRMKLSYRLAKAGYHTGDQLARVIGRLEQSAEEADSRAEAYSLLTQAYLKLPRPDLHRALEANRKLRDVAEASEAELSSAKLLGGELLLRLGKPEEARKSLEKISDQSAPAVVVKARLLRARSYQDEKQWGEAARLYNAALADGRATVPEPVAVYYALGLCYRNQEQPKEAARAWGECLQLARQPEAAAAALALADLRLQEPALEAAVEPLTMAVKAVTAGKEWANPHIDLTHARELYERAVTTFRAASRHDLALKVLPAYTKIADERRALLLRGEVAAEWGRSKIEAAPGVKPPPEVQAQAKELFKQAAEVYTTAARLPNLKPVEQGDYLWNSALNYLACEDLPQATVRLEDFVKLPLEPARLDEAWYRLAEVYRTSGDAKAAVPAYHKCIEFDARFACRARYQLAILALMAGKPDDAEVGLLFNLKMLRWESDPEVLGQTLYALGNLLYQRRDYRRVARHLEDALGRFKDNPEGTRARYQLADSYRQIAAQENQSFLLGENMSAETRQHFQKEHRRWMQKAADEFAVLDQFLETPAGKDHLTSEQRTQVPFIAAKCWFNLGQYDKALEIYNRLIDRYQNKVEGLDALGGAVSCHAALGQVDKVKQRLLQIKNALPGMPEDVRGPWEEWVKEAIKPLKDL